MKKYVIFTGNFGSGKSELAMNLAIKETGSHQPTLVDLDIVNPYFRTSERYQLLAQMGVRLIAPPFARDKIEIMSLSAEIFSIFAQGEGSVIIDAGGDPIGAVALGQYKPNFSNIPRENLDCLMVVNPFRPLADTPQKAVDLMRQIEVASRQTMTGLINNANLGNETTAAELVEGYKNVRKMSQMTGVPVYATAGTASVLAAFDGIAAKEGFEDRYIGKRMEIDILMHRSWEKFLKEGL